MNFREWLQNMSGKTKIAIFDFDGTLANTPLKPQDPEDRKRMGWDGKDWWGSAASMPQDISMNDEIVQAMHAARQDPETYVAILTGRRGVIADKVRELLWKHGLVGRRQVSPTNQKALDHMGPSHPEEEHPHAHDEYYSGDFSTEPDYPRTGKKNKPDGSTLVHKTYIIKNKLMNNNIRQIDLWDDREDHIPHMIKLLLDLLKEWPNLEHATMHRVFPPEQTGAPKAWVQHIPVRLNTGKKQY